MKILVTGALGHIGSQLIRILPDIFPAAQIIMIDNMLTQRYCSLFNLPPQGNYSFSCTDIATCDLNQLLDGIDVVIHLAAITDATTSFAHRDAVEEINYAATARLAEGCARNGCRLIFISTTSVYGSQSDVVDEACPITELIPQSPYAESKLKAEQMLQQEGAAMGLRFVILRFGTIFGISPGMRFHTAINKFVWQANLGEPITVWRTALHQHRPYLDLSDAVTALAFVIKQDLFNTEIFNVLTLNATVNQIVEEIKKEFPSLQVTFVDTEIMNQLSYHVSRAKLESKGFTFNGSLEQGVRATCHLLRQMNSLPKR
ncbi:MAG: NAD-dependent epimerase/dehydratase family protein [Geobacter sp.]|nr:NAD-dependent epimerase/dehydratase family protein [Geobacter sp.]